MIASRLARSTACQSSRGAGLVTLMVDPSVVPCIGRSATETTCADATRLHEEPGFGSTERKPTEGFEPSTPALRERCSGQLSYVGVGGECSRGKGFSNHGSTARDSCREGVLGAPGRVGVEPLA